MQRRFFATKLGIVIRWLCVVYEVLGLVTAVAFVLASPIAAVGFFAWGVVLLAATGLLMEFFRRACQECGFEA